MNAPEFNQNSIYRNKCYYLIIVRTFMIVGLHVDLIDYHLFSCTVKKVGQKKNGRMVQGGRGKFLRKVETPGVILGE